MIMDDELRRSIDDRLVTWLGYGPAMAAECRTGDGGKQCYVCGRRDQLVLIMPGWGGVWACHDCKTASEATPPAEDAR